MVFSYQRWGDLTIRNQRDTPNRLLPVLLGPKMSSASGFHKPEQAQHGPFVVTPCVRSAATHDEDITGFKIDTGSIRKKKPVKNRRSLCTWTQCTSNMSYTGLCHTPGRANMAENVRAVGQQNPCNHYE